MRQFQRSAVSGGVTLLESYKETLDYLEAPERSRAQTKSKAGTGTVFIVHGHDERRKSQVARLLEKTGSSPVVILHEQDDEGRTLLEKFEAHAAASGFALILLTADDVGGAKDQGQQPRARQNVVFEFGYFAGLLGRRNVVVLYEEGVELPSDVHGLLYKPLDAAGAWQYAVLKELKSAGFDYSLDRV